MWTLAVVLYGSGKWLTWRRTRVPAAPWWKQAGYLLAWPGMDARSFLESHADSQDCRSLTPEWLFAFAKLVAGVVLLFVVAGNVPPHYPYLIGWIGMIGIVMILHFGLFHVLSCGWRAAGVNAQPLMNAPLLSSSVSQFWGRRWNTAFRDLTNRFLFRPLVPSLGPRGALLAGFVFSGLIHELVTSLAARGGYGGPTLFFLMQALAIVFARSSVGRRMRLSTGLSGALFTAVALLGPACLLFHRPFVFEIVLPFMHALGAIQ